MKYFEESIQILQELADKIQERQMSLKNIPGEVIQSLVLTFMGKEACKYFLESYKLAAEFGDEEQQAAVILMLRELIRGQWEKEKEKEQEIFEKERALSVKYGKRQEITTAYFENEITEEFICDKTWEYAAVLKQGKSVELFSKVCDAVNLCNIERIKKQDKIRVAFLTKDSTEWSVDVLYQQLAHDERYEVCVLVAPFLLEARER